MKQTSVIHGYKEMLAPREVILKSIPISDSACTQVHLYAI